MNQTTSTVTKPKAETRAALATARFDRRDALWLMLLAALAVGVLGKDISKGGLRSIDSPVHAMDGVLIHDWVAAGPSAWTDPMGFAVEQYAHYPSLSIGSHYPPGFAIVEAAFFGVFGISAVSARMSVVFMGVLGVVGAYLFMRSLSGRAVSALAGIALLVMPGITQWGQQTMLEVPTLTIMIWAAVALTHYVKKPSAARLTLVLAMTLLGLCFKQNAVFLIGAVTATIGVCAWRGDARWRHVIVPAALCIAVPLGIWLSLSDALTKLVDGNDGAGAEWSLRAFTQCARYIPGEVSLWLLAAAVVGFAISWRRSVVFATFLAVWLFGCYAMVSVAEFKFARFFCLGLFPFAIWAALGCGLVLDRLPSRWRTVVVALGVVVMSKVAFDRPIPYFPDHGPTVITHRDKIEGHAVLFSGLRDGDFVFAVRQHIPWRKAVVIRASKLLYTCLAHPMFDLKANVSDYAEIDAAILPLGLTHLFIERENRVAVSTDTLLRDYLAQSQSYSRVDSMRLAEEPEPNYRNVTMDVYESTSPPVRTVEYLDVPVPRANRTVRVNLGGWSG